MDFGLSGTGDAVADVPRGEGGADWTGAALGTLGNLGQGAFRWLSNKDTAAAAAAAAPYTAAGLGYAAQAQSAAAAVANAQSNRTTTMVILLVFMVVLLRVRPQGND